MGNYQRWDKLAKWRDLKMSWYNLVIIRWLEEEEEGGYFGVDGIVDDGGGASWVKIGCTEGDTCSGQSDTKSGEPK